MFTMQHGAGIGTGDIRLGQQQASVEVEFASDRLEDLERYFGPEPTTEPMHYTIVLSHNHGLSVSSNRANWSAPILSQQEPTNFIYTYLSKRKVYIFEREVDLHRTRTVQVDLRYLVSKVSRCGRWHQQGRANI